MDQLYLTIDNRDVPWLRTVNNLEFCGFGRMQTIVPSPDKTMIISANYDNDVQVWNAKSKKIITVFRGHQGWVSSLAVSCNNLFLLSGSFDRNIFLWDLQLLQKIDKFNVDCYVMCVGFSSDFQYIAAGLSDGNIQIWLLQNKFKNYSIKASRSHIIQLKFIHNNCQLFALGNDSNCKIYYFPAFTERQNIKFGKEKIINAEIFKDSKFIIMSFVDQKFRVESYHKLVSS